MSDYRFIPDQSMQNQPVNCNTCGRACWFNWSVRHPRTGRRLLLIEPFEGLRPPKPHTKENGCLGRKYGLGYVNMHEGFPAPEYNNDKNVIDYTRPHIKTMIFNRTEPSAEVREQANIQITCPRCNHKTEPYYLKFHTC